jgi:hypothetical protein
LLSVYLSVTGRRQETALPWKMECKSLWPAGCSSALQRKRKRKRKRKRGLG